ncbi:hypothetical protein GCM10009764_25810 [Nocardia ninae]|uniref:Uncharacterized protein n=2 Tax=Nocardia ninae TaxID=356145 RepID=A0A511MCF8_9NOCA|nr:hypothetical protein NN4_26900 [Nocardia ninae NBRC 108245]
MVSASAARELTDRICAGVEAVWELVMRAFTTRAWTALGYSSWDEYCASEFDTTRLRLPREQRREVVASMHEIGMSTRAIASAIGSSTRTVGADLGQVSSKNTPGATVTGLDGKSYPAVVTPPAHRDAPDPPGPEIASFPTLLSSDSGSSEPETDASSPPRPRRTPLPDSFWAAVRELRKSVERLQRLSGDDRFASYAEQLAKPHHSDLIRARDTVQTVIDLLPQPDTEGTP